MNVLNYSLAAIISYLGLSIGLILAIIAKEELKAGKKYFILLQKAILLLIFIFLIYFLKFNLINLIIVLLFIFIYLIKYYWNKRINESFYIYLILSIIFYISSKSLNLFIIESSLIFLYGLPTGTLLTTKNKKESIINILKNMLFIILAIILFFLF